MVSGHVESLFSAAYRRRAEPGRAGRLDRHLVNAPQCAAAFAELTTAVTPSGSKPRAQMPHPVRLPEGSPVPGRRGSRLPARLSQGRRLLAGPDGGRGWWWRGAAAVVVVGHLNSGTVVPSSSSAAHEHLRVARSPLRRELQFAPRCRLRRAPASSPRSGSCPVCSPKALPISKAEALEIPTGFPNHATEDNGVSTGVVATPGVELRARCDCRYLRALIDDSSHAVLPPLHRPGRAAVLLLEPGGRLHHGRPHSGRGLTVDGQPLLQVTVPATAVAGETYDILVPAPDAAVILTIQIS